MFAKRGNKKNLEFTENAFFLGIGEFSVIKDMAFERHLKKLDGMTKRYRKQNKKNGNPRKYDFEMFKTMRVAEGFWYPTSDVVYKI